MKLRIPLVVATALISALTLGLARAARTPPRTVPFESLSLTLEVDASEGQAALVFACDTEEHLEHLFIRSPAGETVFHVEASDPTALGIMQFLWEISGLDYFIPVLAWPEGEYEVTGVGFDGTLVIGTATLRHQTASAPVLLSPRDGEYVDEGGLRVRWEGDDTIDHYLLEVDDLQVDHSFVLRVPAGASSYAYPGELLEPGGAYRFSLKAVSPNGNTIVTEVAFQVLD